MKTFIVIANAKWRQGCDCSFFTETKAGGKDSAIKRATPWFENFLHFSKADSVEILAEELTPEKINAIREGYAEMTVNERNEQRHSRQWYLLDELRIAVNRATNQYK